MSTSSNNSPSSLTHRYLLVCFPDCEDVEKYRPGGFHPVHLGDVYDQGRYTIVHKLGSGGYSTVWLARDTAQDKWVALKIHVAEKPASLEKSIYLAEQVLEGSDLRKSFGVADAQFTIEGPNGSHLCLVLPALGPAVINLAMDGASKHLARLKPQMVRSVAVQTADLLAGLHRRNLCHGGTVPILTMHQLPHLTHILGHTELTGETRYHPKQHRPRTTPHFPHHKPR